jgi:hypothetical protein
MLKRALASLCVLATVLAACGSDDPPADTAAGYQGAWASGCYAEGDTVYRYRDTVSLTRSSGTRMTYAGSLAMYSNANCSGSPDDVAEYAGAVSFEGTKSIGATNAHKTAVTPADQDTIRTVFLLQGNELQVGRKGGADAEGYPVAIETAYRFTRSK